MSRLHKLKPGPGLTRGEVGASQRGRLLAAAIALAGEPGAGAATVRALSAAAEISTGTFYAHFANVDQCMAAAVNWASRRALSVGVPRAGPNDGRSDFRAQIQNMLDWAASETRQARLLLIDCYGEGAALADERRRAERRFESVLGNSFGPAAGHVDLQVRGMVAALTHAARAQLLTNEMTRTLRLASELELWALTVYTAPKLAEFNLGAPPLPASQRLLDNLTEVGDERGRVLDAVAKLAAQHGYLSLTGPRIRTQAGIVRRRFDALFPSVEQCFFEGIERVVLSEVGRAERTSRGGDGWPAAVGRASAVMCRELAYRPEVARLTLVEILAAGPAGLRCREKLVTELAARLRSHSPPDWRSSRLEATASVAAAWRIIESEVLVGRERRLPQLAPMVAQALIAPAYARRRTTPDQ